MRRQHFLAASVALAAAGRFPMTAAAASPAPAAESAYDLVTPTGTIFGTALIPVTGTPPPVVLIIAGSGPTDRDGNGPGLALNMYRKLAATLADAGIASVRYDKRGIAASHAAAAAESDLRFETYIDDAAAWIGKLRADTRFSRIIVAGHSEGSLVGMVAAQHAPVDAYVSLEGAGFPAADVLRTQLRPQISPYPDLTAAVEKVLTSLSNGNVDAADVPPALQALFRPSVQPYLISWFKYDPRREIAKLHGRVTIVQGTHDVQVPVDNGRALAAAAPGASFVLIDGMTHVLTDDAAETLAGQISGAYADAARPLDANLVHALVSAATGT